MFKSNPFQRLLKVLIFILMIAMVSLPKIEAAIQLTHRGTGWTLPVNSANLVAGAGSDLKSTYLSTVNATILTIKHCKNNSDNWRVDVSRSDTIWDNVNLMISVLRTSDGNYSKGATISGGSSFTPVTTAATTFFSGSGDHHNINIQYQISGMSVKTAPNLYNTLVTFTLVDTI